MITYIFYVTVLIIRFLFHCTGVQFHCIGVYNVYTGPSVASSTSARHTTIPRCLYRDPRRGDHAFTMLVCTVRSSMIFYEDLLSLNQWTFLYVRLLYWKSQWHSKRKKTIMKLYIFGHSSIYTIWFWYWNYVNCKWSFRLFE